ncbi:hypothetical protein DFH09DRAFT_1067794 [Mycena vulgaris]|nr:hypothetical protein DFH09DRAFT_1067794 [Mycena vulgaris]
MYATAFPPDSTAKVRLGRMPDGILELRLPKGGLCYAVEQQSNSDSAVDSIWLAGWDAHVSPSVRVKFACTQPDYGPGRGLGITLRMAQRYPTTGLVSDWMRVVSHGLAHSQIASGHADAAGPSGDATRGRLGMPGQLTGRSLGWDRRRASAFLARRECRRCPRSNDIDQPKKSGTGADGE